MKEEKHYLLLLNLFYQVIKIKEYQLGEITDSLKPRHLQQSSFFDSSFIFISRHKY